MRGRGGKGWKVGRRNVMGGREIFCRLHVHEQRWERARNLVDKLSALFQRQKIRSTVPLVIFFLPAL